MVNEWIQICTPHVLQDLELYRGSLQLSKTQALFWILISIFCLATSKCSIPEFQPQENVITHNELLVQKAISQYSQSLTAHYYATLEPPSLCQSESRIRSEPFELGIGATK